MCVREPNPRIRRHSNPQLKMEVTELANPVAESLHFHLFGWVVTRFAGSAVLAHHCGEFPLQEAKAISGVSALIRHGALLGRTGNRLTGSYNPLEPAQRDWPLAQPDGRPGQRDGTCPLLFLIVIHHRPTVKAIAAA
jgi:hypothetical protein